MTAKRKTAKKATKKAPRKVKYTNAKGETKMVTPAQKKAYTKGAKKAAKKAASHRKAKTKNWYRHVSPENGESYTIHPDGTRTPSFPKVTAKKRKQMRKDHVAWLRKQSWYTPDAEREKAWINGQEG